MVESAAQAKKTCAGSPIPPEGVRGIGAALARASRFSDIPDYLTTANEELCLIVQVENRAGIAALYEILAIDGVYCVFIGPSDLASDVCHLGSIDAPEVVDAVTATLRQIKAAGKALGALTTDTEFIRTCLDFGATFVAVGVDVMVFAEGMRALAGEYRRSEK